MLQKLLFGLLILVACGAVGVLGVIGYIYYKEHTIRQNIAKNVEITPEWKDIPIKPSVSPVRISQTVLLEVDGMDATIDRNGVSMTLENGTQVKPEFELVDENGHAYPLRFSSLLNSTPGAGFNSERSNETAGKKFKTLRVRSDVPFQASKIIWHDKHLK